MKYLWTLAALAALASAQDSGLPECAAECIADATAAETDCTPGDTACSCLPENQAAIRGAATSCVIDACGVDVAMNEVLPASEALCENLGDGGDDDQGGDEDQGGDDEEQGGDDQEQGGDDEEQGGDDHEDDGGDAEESHVPVPPPTHSGNDTIPEPSHVETDGASTAGFMGVAAMLGLAAIAL